MTKPFWITRDEPGEDYDLWLGKPVCYGRWVSVTGDSTWLTQFAAEKFERHTDIRLPGGKDSIVQVKLTAVK